MLKWRGRRGGDEKLGRRKAVAGSCGYGWLVLFWIEAFGFTGRLEGHSRVLLLICSGLGMAFWGLMMKERGRCERGKRSVDMIISFQKDFWTSWSKFKVLDFDAKDCLFNPRMVRRRKCPDAQQKQTCERGENFQKLEIEI